MESRHVDSPAHSGSRARVRSALATVLFLSLAACGGGDSTPTGPVDDDPPGGDDRVVLASPSFEDHIFEIFERRGCASEGCHLGEAGGLSMVDVQTAYADLVGTTSGCNGLIRVVPADVANSYLVTKLQASPPCGARMPLGDEPLDSIDMANIQNWIARNALNN
jgi:hypothetical protein